MAIDQVTCISSAEKRPKLQTHFVLSHGSEVELYNVRDTQLFLAQAHEAAGDEAAAGTFRLLADATSQVIDGLIEEVREVEPK